MLPSDIRARLRKSSYPKWVPPMLATLMAQPFSREGWLFEPKLDGQRCLVLRSGTDVRLYSRNQRRLNDTYPELVGAFHNQKAQFAVDGEIVAFEGQITSFAKLQHRMQIRNPSAQLLRKIPVLFYAFDLLHLDGYDTRQVPLVYRKKLLHEALDFKDPLRFTEHRETDGEAYYREACSKRWEGVIGKNCHSIYVSARSREWLKLKCINQQEFVIGGYTEPQGRRIGFGALLVGYYERGRLVYAGKVGTGFDTDTLSRLGQLLQRLESRTSPFAGDAVSSRGVHWAKPKLVAQIGFTEWTSDGKLRHPRFLGLRSDKTPREVVREQ